jgi:hypothetical protein
MRPFLRHRLELMSATAVLALGGLACSGAPLGGGTGGRGAGGSTGFGGDGAPCTYYDGCKGGLGGSGGSGGTIVDGGNSVICEQLAEKYAAVVSAAAACTPGAPNQCQALVGNVPTNCPDSLCGDQSYVNDGASVEAMRDSWLNEGCGGPPNLCIAIACDPAPTPSVCMPVPSAGTSTGKSSSVGICVPVSSTDGGAPDAGATDAAPSDGGETCDQLAADYAVAVTAAETCTPGAASQCLVRVSMVPSACPLTGCGPEVYVTDASGVKTALARWVAQCAKQPIACSQIACQPPVSAVSCLPQSTADGGTTGVCSLVSGAPTN